MKTLVVAVVLAAVSASPLSAQLNNSPLWLDDRGSSQPVVRVKRQEYVDITESCCGELNIDLEKENAIYEECKKELDPEGSNYQCEVVDCLGKKLGFIGEGELLVDEFTNYMTGIYNEDIKNITTRYSKKCSVIANQLYKEAKEDECYSLLEGGYFCTKGLVELVCPDDKRSNSDSCNQLRKYLQDNVDKNWNPDDK